MKNLKKIYVIHAENTKVSQGKGKNPTTSHPFQFLSPLSHLFISFLSFPFSP